MNTELEIYMAVAGFGILLNLLAILIFSMMVLDKYGIDAAKNSKPKDKKRKWKLLIPFYAVFKYTFYIYPLLKKYDNFDDFIDASLEIQ